MGGLFYLKNWDLSKSDLNNTAVEVYYGMNKRDFRRKKMLMLIGLEKSNPQSDKYKYKDI